MANTCNVDINIIFRKVEYKTAFLLAFKEKIVLINSKNKGVEIGKSNWLFDVIIEDDNKCSVDIRGWVESILDRDVMIEFAQYLKEMNVTSFECHYEDASNQIYGLYVYSDNELWDNYIDSSSPIWGALNYDDDEYFDQLESILENNGESKLIL